MDAAGLIREARGLAGLSQAGLAFRAGTSQSAIARYESGATQPSLPTLERLLAACGARLEMRLAMDMRRTAVSASVVRQHRRALLDLARRYGAHNLRIFGSAARGEAGPDSDIDLLIDLEPGRTLLDLVGLRQDASDLLGVDVDVATLDMLREPVRREAERDAIPV